MIKAPQGTQGIQESQDKKDRLVKWVCQVLIAGHFFLFLAQVNIEHHEKPIWIFVHVDLLNNCTVCSDCMLGFWDIAFQSYWDIQIIAWFPKFVCAHPLAGCSGFLYLFQAGSFLSGACLSVSVSGSL